MNILEKRVYMNYISMREEEGEERGKKHSL